MPSVPDLAALPSVPDLAALPSVPIWHSVNSQPYKLIAAAAPNPAIEASESELGNSVWTSEWEETHCTHNSSTQLVRKREGGDPRFPRRSERQAEAEVSTQQRPSIPFIFLPRGKNAGCSSCLLLPSLLATSSAVCLGWELKNGPLVLHACFHLSSAPFFPSFLLCLSEWFGLMLVMFFGVHFGFRFKVWVFFSLTAQLSFICHSSCVLAAHTHPLLEQASSESFQSRGRVAFRQLKPCYAAAAAWWWRQAWWRRVW